MEKIIAGIRSGVIDRNGKETEEFITWKQTCSRPVSVLEEWTHTGPGSGELGTIVIFECEDDRALYLMTYTTPAITLVTASFYCPYIPSMYDKS